MIKTQTLSAESQAFKNYKKDLKDIETVKVKKTNESIMGLKLKKED